MISYNDFKEILNDIKKDKIMVWFTRILLGVLTISFIVICFATLIRGCNNKPVRFLWGLYESNPKDTLIKNIEIKVYDTVYLKSEKKPIFSTKTLHDKTNVKSINQKGGQTGRDFTNYK